MVSAKCNDNNRRLRDVSSTAQVASSWLKSPRSRPVSVKNLIWSINTKTCSKTASLDRQKCWTMHGKIYSRHAKCTSQRWRPVQSTTGMEVVKVVFCRGYTAAVLATEPAAEHEDSLGFAAFRCVLLCTPRIWKGHGMTLHKSLWRTLMENASGVDGFCLLTVAESRWLSCFASKSP